MFGDVVLCEFPFTSGAKSKIRPALLLFDFGEDALICRITSVLHSEPLDVQIRDWRGAGLLRPSVARLSRLVTAEKTIFLRCLGRLTAGDAAAIADCWNAKMKLRVYV